MMTAELLVAEYTLGRLLQGIEGVNVSRDVVVSGLALDSRKVQAGDLFLAVAGTQTHGLQHARQAIALGASRRFGAFGVFATAEWFQSVDPYSVLEPDAFIGQTSGDTITVTVKRAAGSVLNWGVGVEMVLGERSELYAALFTDNSALEPVAGSIPVALASWDILNFSFGGAVAIGNAEFTAGVSIGLGSDQVEQLVNLSGEDVSPRGVTYRSLGLLLGIGFGL